MLSIVLPALFFLPPIFFAFIAFRHTLLAFLHTRILLRRRLDAIFSILRTCCRYADLERQRATHAAASSYAMAVAMSRHAADAAYAIASSLMP